MPISGPGSEGTLRADEAGARPPARSDIWRRACLLLIWVGIPLVASAIVLTHHDRTWFFYDEWRLVARVLRSHNHLDAATEPFNGHLWFFPYLVYLAQVDLFGLTSHFPVYAVFTVGLIALSIAVALTLRSLQVPALPAVVGGVAVTYFGTGAQSMVFAVILSANAAIFWVLVAGVVGLRSSARARAAVAIALLLLIATAFDSGVTAAAGVFVVVIVVTRWRQEIAWIAVALVPPILVGAIWLLVAGTSGEIDKPISLPGRLEFAGRLLLRSVGGFVGGTELAGAAILAGAFLIIAPGIATARLRGLPLLGLVAGGLTAVTISLAIAWTRAGVVGGDFFDFNRYLSQVAIFALIALAPAVLVSVPRTVPRSTQRITGVATVVFALIFVANLRPLSDYRASFEHWNLQTRNLVRQSLAVLDRGCPAGEVVDPDARPIGRVSPQVSVGLLQEARARGLFNFEPYDSVNPAMVARICKAGGSQAPP